MNPQAPPRVFCTYFNRHYLPRGILLHSSLSRHCPNFLLYVLCLDDATFDYCSNLSLPSLKPISLGELERADPELQATKATRSTVEYYFTCSPCLPLHVLRLNPTIDSVTYLDADLYFFSSPEPLFEEMGNGSILMIEHRFSAANSDHLKYGRFNVGYMSFRNDDSGRKCLEWWREQCVEWCYDRLEETRFADQKYLDAWPSLFPGVVVSRNAGANLAPWNLDRHRVSRSNGRIYVDNSELVFFHFAGIRGRHTIWIDLGVSEYSTRVLPCVVRKHIYLPYLRLLRGRAIMNARRAAATEPAPQTGSGVFRVLNSARKLVITCALRLPAAHAKNFASWLKGHTLLAVGRRVF